MPTAEHHNPAAHAGPDDKPLVLFADDFADARELYRDVLELKGFTVITADDGLEAVEAARRDHPALILLDIRMPRMSGVEAMRALKADPSFERVPIVAVTAHAFASDRAKLLDQGFDVVLTKPCLPEVLTQTVESLLGISPGG